jgi:hypothetical protein
MESTAPDCRDSVANTAGAGVGALVDRSGLVPDRFVRTQSIAMRWKDVNWAKFSAGGRYGEAFVRKGIVGSQQIEGRQRGLLQGAVGARHACDGEGLDLRERQHPDRAADQSGDARGLEGDQAELGGLLADLQSVQRVDDRERAQHQRSGRLGARDRDFAPAQQSRRSDE